MAGDPRYKAFLDEQWELHKEKSAGYGTEDDPFANLRSTEWIGVPAWKMCLVKASDKWFRIQQHLAKGVIPGDSLENDLRDMANYLGYAKILYEEWMESKGFVKDPIDGVLVMPDVPYSGLIDSAAGTEDLVGPF